MRSARFHFLNLSTGVGCSRATIVQVIELLPTEVGEHDDWQIVIVNGGRHSDVVASGRGSRAARSVVDLICRER